MILSGRFQADASQEDTPWHNPLVRRTQMPAIYTYGNADEFILTAHFASCLSIASVTGASVYLTRMLSVALN